MLIVFLARNILKLLASKCMYDFPSRPSYVAALPENTSVTE